MIQEETRKTNVAPMMADLKCVINISLSDSHKSFERLEKLCAKGIKRRYGKDNAQAERRLNYELGIIKKRELTDGFLAALDIAEFARANDILLGPGRGSAAGSMVLYVLGVNDIDPVKYKLMTDRFLIEGRKVEICIEVSSDIKKIAKYVQGRNDMTDNEFKAGGPSFKIEVIELDELDIIKRTANMVKEKHGTNIDFANLDYGLKEVYEAISSGEVSGIFPLEFDGVESMLKEANPQSIEDLSAFITLCLPGNMELLPRYIQNKKMGDKLDYFHPLVKKALSATYGSLIYQEQVCELIEDFMGCTPSAAELMRRELTKRDVGLTGAMRIMFISDPKEGIDEDTAKKVFNLICRCSTFNKSHAVALVYKAYIKAYLKTFYSREDTAAQGVQ